jgi:hypothetical protein
MALNPIRFLGQLAHDTALTHLAVLRGLNYSRVGDCLDFDDYSALSKATTMGEIRDLAYNALPRYYRAWDVLGKPATAETWHAAMFGAEPSAAEARKILAEVSTPMPG